MNVYFDNAATTKVRGEVIDDISNVLKDCLNVSPNLIKNILKHSAQNQMV